MERDDTHSEQFGHTVKAALYKILIKCAHCTEWVFNKPFKLAALNLKLAVLKAFS